MQGNHNSYQVIEEVEGHSKWSIARIMTIVTGLVVCCGIVLFSGQMSAQTSIVETNLAVAAVVTPGSPMSNGDELWNCNPVSIDRNAACVVNLKQQPDFKMVFYKANIYCFARVNAKDDKSWKIVFTQLSASKLVANWGTPYWVMDRDYPLKDPKTNMPITIDTVALFNNGKGATKLAYVTRDSISPDTGKNYDGIYVIFRGNKLDASGNPITGKFTDLLALVPKIKGPVAWGCDKVEFQLNPDGNLLLMPYQSKEKILEIKTKFGGTGLVNCGPVMFSTGTYNEIRKAKPALNLKPL